MEVQILSGELIPQLMVPFCQNSLLNSRNIIIVECLTSIAILRGLKAVNIGFRRSETAGCFFYFLDNLGALGLSTGRVANKHFPKQLNQP